MPPHVVLLLGKPPRPGTVVAEVAEVLAGRGLRVETVLPHERRLDGAGVEALVGAVDGADLVVHRGLAPSVDPLLDALVARGLTLCNPAAGVRTVQDRDRTRSALVAAGVPTPTGRAVGTWTEVLEIAAEQPAVVKLSGSGRGDGVLLGTTGLPGAAPADGPYWVERLVVHDGVDRKLYVAGDRVHGLLKGSTLVAGHSTHGEPFEVPAALRDLALAAAAALDLHLVGIDVVEARGDVDGASGDTAQADGSGLYVVDANPFPGYRSVAGAAASVADHLLRHLDGGCRRDGIPGRSAGPAS